MTPVTRTNTKVVKFIVILPRTKTLRMIISKEIKMNNKRLLFGSSALKAKKKYTINYDSREGPCKEIIIALLARRINKNTNSIFNSIKWVSL